MYEDYNDMLGIIYKFTILDNDYKFNNKRPFYIGQHWHKFSVEHFLSGETYYYSGGGSIWNAYMSSIRRKHGQNWKNYIKREVLFSSETISKSGLNKMEKYYINKCKSLSDDGQGGMNIINGAAIEVNPATTDIVKRKISNKMRGRKFSETHIQRLKEYWTSERLSGDKNPNYGNHWSNEQKQKMREQRLGMYDGDKNPNYGNYWSDEQKQRMSVRLRKRYKDGYVNPMTGKVRITNGVINTVIPKGEPLPAGFRFGMKPRNKHESKKNRG